MYQWLASGRTDMADRQFATPESYRTRRGPKPRHCLCRCSKGTPKLNVRANLVLSDWVSHDQGQEVTRSTFLRWSILNHRIQVDLGGFIRSEYSAAIARAGAPNTNASLSLSPHSVTGIGNAQDTSPHVRAANHSKRDGTGAGFANTNAQDTCFYSYSVYANLDSGSAGSESKGTRPVSRVVLRIVT